MACQYMTTTTNRRKR